MNPNATDARPFGVGEPRPTALEAQAREQDLDRLRHIELPDMDLGAAGLAVPSPRPKEVFARLVAMELVDGVPTYSWVEPFKEQDGTYSPDTYSPGGDPDEQAHGEPDYWPALEINNRDDATLTAEGEAGRIYLLRLSEHGQYYEFEHTAGSAPPQFLAVNAMNNGSTASTFDSGAGTLTFTDTGTGGDHNFTLDNAGSGGSLVTVGDYFLQNVYTTTTNGNGLYRVREYDSGGGTLVCDRIFSPDNYADSSYKLFLVQEGDYHADTLWAANPITDGTGGWLFRRVAPIGAPAQSQTFGIVGGDSGSLDSVNTDIGLGDASKVFASPGFLGTLTVGDDVWLLQVGTAATDAVRYKVHTIGADYLYVWTGTGSPIVWGSDWSGLAVKTWSGVHLYYDGIVNGNPVWVYSINHEAAGSPTVGLPQTSAFYAGYYGPGDGGPPGDIRPLYGIVVNELASYRLLSMITDLGLRTVPPNSGTPGRVLTEGSGSSYAWDDLPP